MWEPGGKSMRDCDGHEVCLDRGQQSGRTGRHKMEENGHKTGLMSIGLNDAVT